MKISSKISLLLFFLSISFFAIVSHAEKTALVIQNFRFAPLGFFQDELVERGYDVINLDAEHEGERLSDFDPLKFDLVIVLGGLMGANDTDKYPYLKEEIHILKTRDDHNKPSIGICLGGQLMSRALGGHVSVGQNDREFGLKNLLMSEEGKRSPFRVLQDFPIMEAHNDVFSLPKGAKLLASTQQYQNQAFIHKKSLGMQFHPEVSASTIQIWMDIFQRNHLVELKNMFDYVDQELRPKVIQFWREWLDELES